MEKKERKVVDLVCCAKKDIAIALKTRASEGLPV